MGLEIWIISACVVYFPGAFSINLAYYIEKSRKEGDNIIDFNGEEDILWFDFDVAPGIPVSPLELTINGIDVIDTILEEGIDIEPSPLTIISLKNNPDFNIRLIDVQSEGSLFITLDAF